MKFGTVAHVDHPKPMSYGQLEFETFKNPIWRTAAILKNKKNCHISATVRLIGMKYDVVKQVDPLTLWVVKISNV